MELQEILFSSSDSTASRQISRWEKEGKIKKIASRVYTSYIHDDPEQVIKNNLFKIIGHLYPGIVLSHRSALEFKPTAAGHLFLTYKYKKLLHLPGVTLDIMPGKSAIEGDNQMDKGLFVAQQARALLENFQQSRKPGPLSKTLTLPELEERLERIISSKGEEGLNNIRDKARQIAPELDMQQEFGKFNKLVSAMLSTQPSEILTSPLAIARASGNPYDPKREALFQKLFEELRQQEFKSYPEQNLDSQSFRNFAFFEAYFSNYIEGTEFELREAKEIIRTGLPMPARDEDSHDILGTYQLLSSPTVMRTTPATPEALMRLLQQRHVILLSSRHGKKPGQFKDINNRAGTTDFVDKSLVKGTLIKGFDYYRYLEDPFAKAVYMQFLISEVHPFLDGNGRIARVMMNAELVKAGQTRIIIPTVFREDYIGALKQLSWQQSPSAYIRMLARAQYFSSTVTGDMNDMQAKLEKSNAFLEPKDGKLRILAEITVQRKKARGNHL